MRKLSNTPDPDLVGINNIGESPITPMDLDGDEELPVAPMNIDGDSSIRNENGKRRSEEEKISGNENTSADTRPVKKPKQDVETFAEQFKAITDAVIKNDLKRFSELKDPFNETVQNISLELLLNFLKTEITEGEYKGINNLGFVAGIAFLSLDYLDDVDYSDITAEDRQATENSVFLLQVFANRFKVDMQRIPLEIFLDLLKAKLTEGTAEGVNKGANTLGFITMVSTLRNHLDFYDSDDMFYVIGKRFKADIQNIPQETLLDLLKASFLNKNANTLARVVSDHILCSDLLEALVSVIVNAKMNAPSYFSQWSMLFQSEAENYVCESIMKTANEEEEFHLGELLLALCLENPPEKLSYDYEVNVWPLLKWLVQHIVPENSKNTSSGISVEEEKLVARAPQAFSSEDIGQFCRKLVLASKVKVEIFAKLYRCWEALSSPSPVEKVDFIKTLLSRCPLLQEGELFFFHQKYAMELLNVGILSGESEKTMLFQFAFKQIQEMYNGYDRSREESGEKAEARLKEIKDVLKQFVRVTLLITFKDDSEDKFIDRIITMMRCIPKYTYKNFLKMCAEETAKYTNQSVIAPSTSTRGVGIFSGIVIADHPLGSGSAIPGCGH